jgi:two-component system, NarL family, sensor kinase
MQKGDIMESVLLAITLIMLLVCLIIYILFNYKKNHNRFIEELETINSNYERELLTTQLEIQEQTFQHISQDLHDNIGQIISLANLSISNLLDIQNERVTENAKLTMNLLARCLEEIRNLSKTLSSDSIRNIGLVNSIENELIQLRKTGGFQITLLLSGKSQCFNEEKELVLFRIFQEAINNIIKHSRAQTICISLHYGEKNLHFGICDDGIGFSVEEKLKNCNANGSSGLRNIIRRSTLINANYNIASDSKSGTEIHITTPYI